MTREELERAVERAVAFMSPAEVSVVIDLVVGACCEQVKRVLTVEDDPQFRAGFKWAVSLMEGLLRQSFLPTPKEPADGKAD